ncbi:MAG: methyl-accepting chemotaxis protein, partial [Clostridiales bacterium]|nr:methyl-accepting chemotaxis protein [Clostridiales bacterium]
MKSFIKKFRNLLHSFRAKIGLMLLILGIIPVLITGIVTYKQSTDILSKKLETTSTQTILEIGRGLENYFIAMSDLLTVLSNDANIIEANNEISFAFAKGLIANVNNADESILNVYVGTEKKMFYAYPEIELVGYDPTATDWYKESVQYPDDIVFSNPYSDTGTGLMVMSLTKAIKKGNELIGVVGIDISLDYLSASLSNIEIGDTGYVYMADELGYIIAHPDTSLVGTDLVATMPFWADVSVNNEGFMEYEYNGNEYFGSYVTSNLTNWKIMGAMTHNELTNDTNKILDTVLMLLVFLTVISLTVTIVFTGIINKNIQELLTGFNRIDKGDLSARVSIKSKDEFGLLGAQFNVMCDNMSLIIDSVSQSSTTVLDSATELASMSEETNSSASEVSRAVEEVAHGATEQAQSST